MPPFHGEVVDMPTIGECPGKEQIAGGQTTLWRAGCGPQAVVWRSRSGRTQGRHKECFGCSQLFKQQREKQRCRITCRRQSRPAAVLAPASVSLTLPAGRRASLTPPSAQAGLFRDVSSVPWGSSSELLLLSLVPGQCALEDVPALGVHGDDVTGKG